MNNIGTFAKLFESVRTALDARVESSVHMMDYDTALAMQRLAPKKYGPEWDALAAVEAVLKGVAA